jgi:hypothetical protein
LPDAGEDELCPVGADDAGLLDRVETFEPQRCNLVAQQLVDRISDGLLRLASAGTSSAAASSREA